MIFGSDRKKISAEKGHYDTRGEGDGSRHPC